MSALVRWALALAVVIPVTVMPVAFYRVVYVHGSELLTWLRGQRGRLSADDCRELFEAVRRISET